MLRLESAKASACLKLNGHGARAVEVEPRIIPMYAFPNLRCLFLAGVSLVLGVTASSARPVYIQDNGGFFSESAKAEASRSIANLEQKLHKEVFVQTFPGLPADVQRGVDLQDKAATARAIGQWALKEFKSSEVNGVYILLVKSPAHLEVEVGTDTQKQAFTLRDRGTLVNLMLADLRAKQYDEALVNGVNFVAQTMRADAPVGGRTTVAQPYDLRRPREHAGGHFLPIIIGLIVVWVVFRLVRSLFRGGGGTMTGTGYSSGPMMGPMSSGGGGFFSSMLGGIFGAAAGNWMYDRFSGRDTPTFGSEPEVRQVDDPGYTGKDTDASGAGGSFDDNSGGGNSGSGGDFGGGDSGGGDSGGGDSGGGGGDF